MNEATSPRRISLFDATLRDGEQAPGNAMTAEQKVRLALAIEAYGADIIEAGYPGSSPVDFEATRLIAAALTTARFATFNRTSIADVKLSIEAGGTGPNHQVQICGTGSDLHLRYKRGISRAEAVRETGEAIRFAHEMGAQDVSYGVEDASRGEKDLIEALVTEALSAGVTTVILADTTGCATPQEYGDLCAMVRSLLPDDVKLSTHCHDDLGLSLANALAGIQAGADEVQATLAGIGERAGNTPVEELAAALSYKGECFGATTSVRLDHLYRTFQMLSETIGMPAPRNKAIFGENAFATEAGIHQDGILKNPATYEFINPYRFDRERSLLVGRHSGRAIIRYLLEDLGEPVDENVVDRLYLEYVSERPDGRADELNVVRERLAATLRARA
ncbi:LeuA family protein [Micromonospora halophytica]|uniref:2-isopropylmalate synthase n=1 Tax=Micromonospora halophytica TaxID=47864 RepID=A0A1C5IM41_9ACTN|nr:pyruvate carboxyltransferase [Micromonospora halophytica]SCG59400.1 2-isopropylmalate synthase [Micromonospora halophytica]